jgi:hypothetical protein
MFSFLKLQNFVNYDDIMKEFWIPSMQIAELIAK